jgi:hypothetical protein
MMLRIFQFIDSYRFIAVLIQGVFTSTPSLETRLVEVIDLVLTSALASQIQDLSSFYDLLEVIDHAVYESDICFFIRYQNYIKITQHCSEKSATFMGSKIVFFFLLHQKST